MHFYALKALHVFPTCNFHSHNENDSHISCIKLPQFLQQVFESQGFYSADPLLEPETTETLITSGLTYV